MKNKPYVPLKITAYFPPPLIPIQEERNETKVIRIKEVWTQEIFMVADGSKNVFTEEDVLSEYGIQKIVDPTTVSYMNLFINGILQPKVNYEVTQGRIKLMTEDIPAEGCPIILQMIKI